MTAADGPRTGGEILAAALAGHGVDTAFGVPGESYLALLDALVGGDIRFVTCRQEGGAAMMAEAHGKLTGRPGVAMVTRGPGATNASAGVHIAQQDSTPMILLVGQVGRDMADREAFQEVDYRAMFAPLAKWAAQIESAGRIPEYVNRAVHAATSGRPGPVVLALPEDMLRERAAPVQLGRYAQRQAHPDPAAMTELRERLRAAERPLMILGGGGWTAEALGRVADFAEAAGLPVGVSFRCQDYIDNRRPCYVGHIGVGVDPALAARVRNADLLIVAGARLGEMTTSGYTLVEAPRPRQTLVHVYPDASELDRVYDADLGIVAGMPAFAQALAGLAPVDGARWRDELAAARADYTAHAAPPGAAPGDLDMAAVVAHMREALPDDAVIANGAGNYAAWVHRFFGYRRFRTQLAPTSGSMGYGVPAAVAAKLTEPGREVVSVSGDGCFLMNGQELATAAHYGLGVVFLVVDNGMYGTIRMHQERAYPGRVSGTALGNPDFAALLHLVVDPEALSPAQTLSGLRATSGAGA